jgi:hypothetical protein
MKNEELKMKNEELFSLRLSVSAVKKYSHKYFSQISAELTQIFAEKIQHHLSSASNPHNQHPASRIQHQ